MSMMVDMLPIEHICEPKFNRTEFPNYSDSQLPNRTLDIDIPFLNNTQKQATDGFLDEMMQSIHIVQG
jgi:hypothetical protein